MIGRRRLLRRIASHFIEWDIGEISLSVVQMGAPGLAVLFEHGVRRVVMEYPREDLNAERIELNTRVAWGVLTAPLGSIPCLN